MPGLIQSLLNVFKKTFTAFSYLVLGVFTLLGIYVLFNLHLFHVEKPLDRKELSNYVAHVDSTNPLVYVANKFDQHQVVLLGELHRRKQDLDLFKQLIPYLYKTKAIKMIGWEFGAHRYQKAADSIVTASNFDRKKAIAIMRKTIYYWNYEDYLEVFKVIWKLNQEILAKGDTVRFLQLNGVYVPRRWDSENDSVRLHERQSSFDNIMPGIVEKEVLAENKKIIIYCGLHHALTKFETPKFLFLKDHGRAGQALYTKHSKDLFQICLLSPFPPRWLLYYEISKSTKGNFVFPFAGVFNQLLDTLQHPFAVDASNPAFGNLKDHDSFYAFDTFSGVALKDMFDGCIMPAAFDQIVPVDVIDDWVTTNQELNEVKNVLPENVALQINSIQDLIDYINPAANRQAMLEFHQLKKFW
ncbi:MAG TPA: hypothetical protein DGG95_17155 [Cytophagales bacterium]|nr:hypothetical protein [Cytophagales bacterium]